MCVDARCAVGQSVSFFPRTFGEIQCTGPAIATLCVARPSSGEAHWPPRPWKASPAANGSWWCSFAWLHRRARRRPPRPPKPGRAQAWRRRRRRHPSPSWDAVRKVDGRHKQKLSVEKGPRRCPRRKHHPPAIRAYLPRRLGGCPAAGAGRHEFDILLRLELAFRCRAALLLGSNTVKVFLFLAGGKKGQRGDGERAAASGGTALQAGATRSHAHLGKGLGCPVPAFEKRLGFQPCRLAQACGWVGLRAHGRKVVAERRGQCSMARTGAGDAHARSSFLAVETDSFSLRATAVRASLLPGPRDGWGERE